jgi:alanyl-tRNA synthetase
MFPELPSAMPQFRKIIEVEEKRYRGAMERTQRAVELILDRREPLTEEKLTQLYDSQGITPELVAQVAAKKGVKAEIPAGFWASVADLHTTEKAEQKKEIIDAKGLPLTKKLYFDNDKLFDFKAKVLKVEGNKVVLDQTAFYPRGGGQEPDHGSMEKSKVYDVDNSNGIIVHMVENPPFKEGDSVKCSVNKERRKQITIHHTATHLIGGAARKVIGPWMWQEGSKKDEDKAHIDLAHYEALKPEEVKKIEKMANDEIKKGIRVEKKVWERTEAEKKFGFGIYQGAAVPSSKLKICSIGDFDHEACGGTHVDNTKEIGQIIITKTERPADGTVRIIYKAGPAAEQYLKGISAVLKESAKLLGTGEENVPKAAAELFEKWKGAKKAVERLQSELAEKKTERLRFTEAKGLKILAEEIPNAGVDQLREISRKLSADNTAILLIGTSDKAYVFGSAGQKAVKAGVNIGKVVNETCAALGGKGGGTPALAQGSGPDKAKAKDALKKARGLLI